MSKSGLEQVDAHVRLSINTIFVIAITLLLTSIVFGWILRGWTPLSVLFFVLFAVLLVLYVSPRAWLLRWG